MFPLIIGIIHSRTYDGGGQKLAAAGAAPPAQDKLPGITLTAPESEGVVPPRQPVRALVNGKPVGPPLRPNSEAYNKRLAEMLKDGAAHLSVPSDTGNTRRLMESPIVARHPKK
jgi:hypothetical protein